MGNSTRLMDARQVTYAIPSIEIMIYAFGIVLTAEDQAVQDLAEEPEVESYEVSAGGAIKVIGERVERIALKTEVIEGKVEMASAKDALPRSLEHVTVLMVSHADGTKLFKGTEHR